MFFDKTCNVSSISYTKVGGSSKRGLTTIYTGIECNFEIQKKPIITTDISKNSNELKYTVVVPIKYNLIKNNYNIELIDDTLGSIGKFIVSGIQSFKSLSGGIDCITFTATEIEGQL